jgi:hypothetical protein
MVTADECLRRQGWADAVRRPLAGDASSRRYDRLSKAGGTAVLMRAPPEAMTPAFIAIAKILANLGLSAPGILAASAEDGMVLLEDFGDDTYTVLLDGGAAAAPLYLLATDALIHLHRRFTGAASLPIIDRARFLDQAMLFCDICKPDEGAAESFRRAWTGPLDTAVAVPSTLLLRDFHAGNLFHLPQRPGVRACGLIDFQDAGIGPVSYDLVSLLQDARRDVAKDIAAACLEHYCAAFPDIDRAAFDASCAILAAQRHVRVIAVFNRLSGLGKPGYLEHLPRLWDLLHRALGHPALGDVAVWFQEHFPPAVEASQQSQQQ